jgi:glycosyltransferase involved in cell wall biosynthesis
MVGLRLLYVVYSSFIEGKANLDVYNPVKILTKNGYVIDLICLNDILPTSIKYGSGKIKLHPIIPPFPLNYLTLPILFVKILCILFKSKPHLILTSGDESESLIGIVISKLTNTPWILILRSTLLEYNAFSADKPILWKFISKILMVINHAIIKKARYVIAIDECIKTFYENLLGKKIEFIQLEAIDPELYEVSLNTGDIKISNNSTFTIVYSGSIRKSRNIDMAIETVHELVKENIKNIKLIITGDGPYKKYLENKILNLGLKKYITIKPWMPKREVLKIIRMADLCLETFPRPWPHNMTPSDKILEYMAMGKCVVASNSLSHRELLKKAECGFLFRPNSMKELVKIIKYLMENRQVLISYGRKAREFVFKKYNVIKTTEEFMNYCKKVLEINFLSKVRG